MQGTAAPPNSTTRVGGAVSAAVAASYFAILESDCFGGIEIAHLAARVASLLCINGFVANLRTLLFR